MNAGVECGKERDEDEKSLSESDDGVMTMFEEAEEPIPEPTTVTFCPHEQSSCCVTLQLVHSSPLWGHLLWSASKIVSRYLDARAEELVRNKNVLELGAAGGLPSLICAKTGARCVVITDYPDANLMSNLAYNVSHNDLPNPGSVHVLGYIWGRDVGELLEQTNEEKFDLLILSDLLFNHQAHHDLLRTISQTMAKTGQTLVFFSHHRPHLAHLDNNFFTLATAPCSYIAHENGEENDGKGRRIDGYGFAVEKILEDKCDTNVMFEEDPGSRDVRATVHGYRITWSTNLESR